MKGQTLVKAALVLASASVILAQQGVAAEPRPGIQWFATLEPALAAAKQSGRPILFLTAAPHCGGVPGAW